MALNKFMKLISSDCSVDLWSDYLLDETIAVANTLQPEDWESIANTVSDQSEVTQQRFASLMPEVQLTFTKKWQILKPLLVSNSSKVVESSLDSLNAMIGRELVGQELDRDFKNQVKTTLNEIQPSGRFSEMIYESILSQIS